MATSLSGAGRGGSAETFLAEESKDNSGIFGGRFPVGTCGGGRWDVKRILFSNRTWIPSRGKVTRSRKAGLYASISTS
ncbi:hypothetical protein GJAV_G00216720 [Gymnothorax javanicus]|nr:hypothetical protein GJAV_G00216720 [Gymnothorax javanicus]